MLRVGDAPLRLLRAVRGLDLADLPDAESCCGFGGTFSPAARSRSPRPARSSWITVPARAAAR
jgi:Fe-S oxidoreductase